MPSIIPGYEYDIFISYRRKDNKYDGWVSEFVINLRKELDATFKEDISIYLMRIRMMDCWKHTRLVKALKVPASFSA